MNTTLIPSHRLLLSSLIASSLWSAACDPESVSLGDDELSASSEDSGQEPSDEAVLRYSQFWADKSGLDVALGPDGSIHVLGWSGYHYEGGDGGFFDDLWLAKLDPDGAVLWEQTESIVGGAVSPIALAVGDTGEIYVAVVDYSVLAGGDNSVRCLDADGNERWRTTLPSRAEALRALPGGGVVIGGSQEAGSNNGIAWAQRLDADGNPLWEQTFGDPAMRYSEVASIALAADGDVLLAGRMGISTQSSQAQAWVAAVDPGAGSMQWERRLSDGIATDRVYDLGVADDGSTLLVGTGGDPWVKSLAPDGGEEWTWVNDTVPGSWTIAVEPDGGFSLADGVTLDFDDPEACTTPFGPCPSAMRVARYAPDLSLRWQITSEECRSANVATATPDGGLLVLAGCDMDPISDVALGLFRYEP